eukprot:Opistho-2@73864
MEYDFDNRPSKAENGADDAKREALRQKVASIRDDIAGQAELIVQEKMMEKIISLAEQIQEADPFRLVGVDKVIDNTVLPVARAVTSDVDDGAPPSKKRKLDIVGDNTVEPIPCNKVVGDFLKQIKKEIMELIQMCNTVKIWIQLNIPRIEDGNNFGVSIQEETVGELTRAEDSGFAVLESITKYYATRGKLSSKMLKYPTIADYRQSVIELDEKEYTNLRMCIVDLRNNYAILNDMIHKNIDKIRKPRNTNTQTLY